MSFPAQLLDVATEILRLRPQESVQSTQDSGA